MVFGEQTYMWHSCKHNNRMCVSGNMIVSVVKVSHDIVFGSFALSIEGSLFFVFFRLNILLTFIFKAHLQKEFVRCERSPVAAVAADGLTSAETFLHY